ncbi:MAG TPA: L,D-transpeptidase family protein [Gaiellaceae bacterium]|nr:L,D-transpeptidase family protein [Gaiellaceae bacterium]
MRRSVPAALAFFACAAAGVLAAFVLAGGVGAQGLLTTTGTTSTGTTTEPEPTLIPPGVTIAGIAVGGLTSDSAVFTVQERFNRGIPLILNGRRRLAPTPGVVGATARVEAAVQRALAAAPGEAVPLAVLVSEERLLGYAANVARRFNRNPVDAQVYLRRGRPKVVTERLGVAVQRSQLAGAIHKRLVTMSRAAVRVPTRISVPETTRRVFRNVIVIHRGSNRLELFNYERLRKRFRVATGQSVYPTPLGRFSIVVKWRNPWWYPPNARWAQGLKPVPPGPNNPLGTRWMGLSAPGVGIHGTPNPGSIGYSVSHGCIRMYIPDAELLFTVVDIGTTVFIVPG